jgi:hypothetical protein
MNQTILFSEDQLVSSKTPNRRIKPQLRIPLTK